jgi:hypothetical protein
MATQNAVASSTERSISSAALHLSYSTLQEAGASSPYSRSLKPNLPGAAVFETRVWYRKLVIERGQCCHLRRASYGGIRPSSWQIGPVRVGFPVVPVECSGDLPFLRRNKYSMRCRVLLGYPVILSAAAVSSRSHKPPSARPIPSLPSESAAPYSLLRHTLTTSLNTPSPQMHFNYIPDLPVSIPLMFNDINTIFIP